MNLKHMYVCTKQSKQLPTATPVELVLSSMYTSLNHGTFGTVQVVTLQTCSPIIHFILFSLPEHLPLKFLFLVEPAHGYNIPMHMHQNHSILLVSITIVTVT